MAGVEDELKEIEEQRIAAFLSRDVEVLRRLHSEGYQLINPGGQVVGKYDYVNGVAAGFIEFKLWEIDGEIDSFVSGDLAVLRYRANVQLGVKGEAQPPQRFWHTEVYQRIEGAWQAVLSQETRVST